MFQCMMMYAARIFLTSLDFFMSWGKLLHPPTQEIRTSQKFLWYSGVKNQLTRTVCVLSHLNASSVTSVS